MGYLMIHCDTCGGEWPVFHRDINSPSARQCPHCYSKIETPTWKQVLTGFGEMRDAEMELAKDHANHMPLFTVDYMSDHLYKNHNERG